MSAKAKTKGNESNHKSEATDVAAIAAISAMPAEMPAPALAEAAAEAPPPELPAKEPLLVRVKVATGSAVVRSFATLRAAQASAIQRTLAWLSGLDAMMARSLATGEGFLLAKLGTTPAAPPDQVPGGYANVASSEARAPQ